MRSSRRIHRARIFGLVSILLAGSMLIINPVNAETAARPFSVAQQDPPTDSDEPPILSDKVDADLAAALDTKGSADFYVDFADAPTSPRRRPSPTGRSGAPPSSRRCRPPPTPARRTSANSWTRSRSATPASGSPTPSWSAGGSTALAQQAAARPTVEAIRAPQTYEIPEPTIGIDEQQIDAVEWGIDRISADEVWSTFGVRGEGIVVGSIDTGVNFQHPALAAQYRGNSGGAINHDYNWFDPSRCVPAGPVRQQQPRHPHDGHDGRRRRRSEPDRGRARGHVGSPRRAARPTPARTGRCWRPASGCWRPPGWTGQVPTRHSDRTSSTTPGADRAEQLVQRAPSTPGAPPASSRRSPAATAARAADRPDRPATTSRRSRPGRSTSTTPSPRPRGGAAPAARSSPTSPRRA